MNIRSMVPILLPHGARISAGIPHHKQGTNQVVVQIIVNYGKGIPVTESAGSGVECLYVRIVWGS